MVKSLIVSSRDVVGGAARAAYRLHEAFLSTGIDSQMLVQFKSSDEETVIGDHSTTARRVSILAHLVNQMPLKVYRGRKPSYFSPAWIPEKTGSRIAQLSPDFINLHWVNNGFLRIETVEQLRKPIIWTMHDMWPFTGGCHYSGGCERYVNNCGACPVLGSTRDKDISRLIWSRKSRSWHNLDITIVALSNWLADCGRKSSLFGQLPIEVIPNCIDTGVWKPIDKNFARDSLNLPQDKIIVGYGAHSATNDPRKGFRLLIPALEILSSSDLGGELQLAVVGASGNSNSMDLALKTQFLGEIRDDEKLLLFYSAIDVFVLPSTQDNLPNTIMEAMACGTPCTAFNVGGIPDLIDHKRNGFLCLPFEPRDLAEGIIWTISDENRRRALSEAARHKVLSTYSPQKVAQQYLNLYEKMVQ